MLSIFECSGCKAMKRCGLWLFNLSGQLIYCRLIDKQERLNTHLVERRQQGLLPLHFLSIFLLLMDSFSNM